MHKLFYNINLNSLLTYPQNIYKFIKMYNMKGYVSTRDLQYDSFEY